MVQLEADASSTDAAEKANIERAVTDLLRRELSERGLNYPVDQGVNCYPKNVARHTTELAFIFHITLRRNPQNDAQTIGALIFHHQFENFVGPPHEYPTALFTCETIRALHSCVLDQVRDYFDKRVAREIEIGTQTQKRGAK